MYIENKLFVELWGDRALFTRPELKVERYSYDVITPSAARNILEAIYWHPGMKFIIDRIYLLSRHTTDGTFNIKENPIQMISVKRNEVGVKGAVSSIKSMMNGGSEAFIDAGSIKNTQQRNSVILKNVHYVIEAHIEMTSQANESDNMAKFLDIFTRRCRKGQCYTQPYFGCREFSANFCQWTNPNMIPAVDINRDFGLMLFDMKYPTKKQDGSKDPAEPIFYRAVMNHGIIQVSGSEVYE